MYTFYFRVTFTLILIIGFLIAVLVQPFGMKVDTLLSRLFTLFFGKRQSRLMMVKIAALHLCRVCKLGVDNIRLLKVLNQALYRWDVVGDDARIINGCLQDKEPLPSVAFRGLVECKDITGLDCYTMPHNNPHFVNKAKILGIYNDIVGMANEYKPGNSYD